MYVYLFEAKSIQAYIFRSGRLKDVIAASERLDRLVDDVPHSTLNRVMEAAGLKSNLLDATLAVKEDVIGFTRCKGGAFYAFCHQQAPLQQLRAIWTLTVQQLLPGLEFADALTEGEDLAGAMNKAHPLLAQARNTPAIKFPLTSAICESARRTGLAAVPLTGAAKFESKEQHTELDIDTEHHRQAYRFLELRKDTLLGKFVGAGLSEGELPEALKFPLDTENFPAFKAADGSREAIRDLALIHLDGNGLGLLLRSLQAALAGKSSEEYSKAFRQFSTALANATQKAAYQATLWLYQNTDSAKSEKNLLPMRPIVLGGDDITLLCQADLAVGYAEQFCKAFKEMSEQELAELHKAHLSKGSSKIKKYLTASGGILYHKASHPFVTCHELVEGLCAEAKKTTKEVDANVGPAAIAFYRISNVISEDISQLRELTQHFKQANGSLMTSLGGYLLEGTSENSLPNLRALADKAREKSYSGQSQPISIAKFRQMATHLAAGDFAEAERIYERALDLQHKQGVENARTWVANPWQPESGQSWLSDLITYAYFNAPSSKKVKENING